MADLSIQNLNTASIDELAQYSRFVVSTGGATKAVEGQTLLNYLTRESNAKGGIKSFETVTLKGKKQHIMTTVDNTEFKFEVLDGSIINSINVFCKTTDGSTPLTTDSGWSKTWVLPTNDKPYMWIYFTFYKVDTASATWTYGPYCVGVIGDRGPQGETGEPASLDSLSVEYALVSDRPSDPSAVKGYSTSFPKALTQGYFLCTRTGLRFNRQNTGTVYTYTVTYIGTDGGNLNPVRKLKTAKDTYIYPSGDDGTLELSVSDIRDIGAIPNGNVTEDDILDGAVKTDAIYANAVTRDKISAGAVSDVLTAKIRADATWTAEANSSVVSTSITVTSLLANDRVVLDVNLTGNDWEKNEEILDAWGSVMKAEVLDGKIKMYLSEAPEVDIPFKILVIRK